MAVRDTDAMIAQMAPHLIEGDVGFVTLAKMDRFPAQARAAVREGEGVTLVLPVDDPLVPSGTVAMRQITLSVHSALDGVGLTAAVAEALAKVSIPCNVVAGYYHDHLFVPADRAEEALTVLRRRAEGV